MGMKTSCPKCGTLVKAVNDWPTTKQPRPFPLQPLLERTRNTPSQWRSRWGMSAPNLRKYMDEGLTAYQADSYAAREGLHPSEVWPDVWWEVA